VHADANAEPKLRPKWAKTTLQDVGDLVGDPTDTRRTIFDFKDPPLASGIKLFQAKYARDLLERFHTTDNKSSPTPFLVGFRLEDGQDTPLVDNTLHKQLVGSLLYLTHSRPDLSYVVGAVSRFMKEPHELHWKATKCILRYVHGTITFRIHYATKSALDLIEFTDSD
jgi:hypothetical protein